MSQDEKQCLLSFFACDGISKSKIEIPFRKLYSYEIIYPTIYSQSKKIVFKDEENDIYYYPIGYKKQELNSHKAMYFSSFNIKWPLKYTLIIWIKYSQISFCTTFDSSYYTPILRQKSQIGVGSLKNGYIYLKENEFNLKSNVWYCIFVFGGNNKSIFYIGDIKQSPKYIGYVGKIYID